MWTKCTFLSRYSDGQAESYETKTFPTFNFHCVGCNYSELSEDYGGPAGNLQWAVYLKSGYLVLVLGYSDSLKKLGVQMTKWLEGTSTLFGTNQTRAQ